MLSVAEFYSLLPAGGLVGGAAAAARSRGGGGLAGTDAASLNHRCTMFLLRKQAKSSLIL
jgi:hypothetical protein